MKFLPIHAPPGWLLFGSKWTPADPSGFDQRMFTCPCARNVSPSGSVIPARSTVYGVGESDPPANATDAPAIRAAHSTSDITRAGASVRAKLRYEVNMLRLLEEEGPPRSGRPG